MDIQCKCGTCTSTFKVDGAMAGKQVVCPNCQQPLTVPVPKAPAQLPRAKAIPAAPTRPTGTAPAAAQTNPTTSSTSSAAFDFNLETKPSTGPAAPTSVAAKPQAKTKKKSSAIPWLVGAGALGVLAVVGVVIVYFTIMTPGTKPVAKNPKSNGNSSKAKTSESSAAGPKGTLVIELPAGSRSDLSIEIDGKRQTVPGTGNARIELAAGKHQVQIRRRGFEPIGTTLTVDAASPLEYTPSWKSVNSAIAANTNANSTDKANGGSRVPQGSEFVIGAGLTPQGFSGWLQEMDSATKRAREQKKDLLVLFGCSDAESDTQKLAAVLNVAERDKVAAAFVPVIVDFPKTRQGFDNVLAPRANAELAQRFNLTELPVIVLMDDQGLPYFSKREFAEGDFDSIGNDLATWQMKKAERDELIQKAGLGDDAAKIDAQIGAVNWLRDNHFITYYAKDVTEWQKFVAKQDPKNEAGKLEVFVEAELTIRANDSDADQIGPGAIMARVLKPWLTELRFKDQDRGASLHLSAAMLMMRGGGRDGQAKQHLERAQSYQPTKRDLAEALAAASKAIATSGILSSGTGFVIAESGYLLTNSHVVEGEGKLVVRIPGGKDTLGAKIIAQDEVHDMALIKIEPPDDLKLTPLALSEAKLGRGTEVAAFGYPLGDAIGSGLKFTAGRVSGLPDASNRGMILLDLRVNPGNSGGPLCDQHGDVIGMVSAKTGSRLLEKVDSYGMAIPTNDLAAFLDQHLPKEIARQTPDETTSPMAWDAVDAKVSSSVLMILKVEK